MSVEQVEQKVKQIIVEQLGVDEAQVDMTASFVDDLGADSLDIVELVMAFEEAFDLDIPDEDAEKIATVKDAVEYIDANLDRPISVVDVALAMKVGLRALTDAFTKHLGATPGRYLRARRLDAANAMMQTNPELSVIDVATHWQFSNPGMFARYFRMRFGCLPSTMRGRSIRGQTLASATPSTSVAPLPESGRRINYLTVNGA